METGSVRDLEVCYVGPDGRLTPVEVNATAMPQAEGLRIVSLVRDISTRKRAEDALHLDEQRMEALLRLQHLTDASEAEILNFAMEEAVRLTASSMGYLGFVDEKETLLTLQAWSKTAMAQCVFPEKLLTLRVEDGGLLVEPIVRRLPVFTNDYRATDPLMNGCPEGHQSIGSHLGVPIIDGGRVVAVAGVANKETPYEDPDAREIELLFQGLWNLLLRRRQQEALLRSEANYRSLVENARSIVLKWDPEGKVTYWNDFAAEFFGYTREEILGKSLFKTIVPEKETTGRDLIDLLHKIGKDPDQFASNINQNTQRNGRKVWIAWANRPVLDADGRVIEVLSYGIDITHLHEGAAALSDSERRYRTLAEAAHDMIFIIGRDDKVQYVNLGAAMAFGMTPEQMTGQPRAALFPEPQAKDQLESLRRVFETGNPQYGQQKTVFPGGDLWLGTWLAPILDAQGSVEAVLGISRDITARVQAEEALAASESSLRTIVDSVPECITVIDGDGILLDMNPAGLAMVGATLEQVRGLSATRIVTPEYQEAFLAFTRRACAGERGAMDFEILSLAGEHLRVSSTAGPLCLHPGEPAVCLAVTRVLGRVNPNHAGGKASAAHARDMRKNRDG
jgi:PAS domain S-box-containing protein